MYVSVSLSLSFFSSHVSLVCCDAKRAISPWILSGLDSKRRMATTSSLFTTLPFPQKAGFRFQLRESRRILDSDAYHAIPPLEPQVGDAGSFHRVLVPRFLVPVFSCSSVRLNTSSCFYETSLHWKAMDSPQTGILESWRNCSWVRIYQKIIFHTETKICKMIATAFWNSASSHSDHGGPSFSELAVHGTLHCSSTVILNSSNEATDISLLEHNGFRIRNKSSC